MRSKKERIDTIEKVLFVAHKNKTAPELGPDWRQKVMRHIRNLYDTAQRRQSALVERFMFRRVLLPFASAAGAAAVVMLLLTLNSVLGVRYEIFNLIVEDFTSLTSLLLGGL